MYERQALRQQKVFYSFHISHYNFSNIHGQQCIQLHKNYSFMSQGASSGLQNNRISTQAYVSCPEVQTKK